MCELEQEKNLTEIYHYTPIENHISCTGMKQCNLFPEVSIGSCSIKYLVLKKLQENNCGRVAFLLKLQAVRIILRKYLICYEKYWRHSKTSFFV